MKNLLRVISAAIILVIIIFSFSCSSVSPMNYFNTEVTIALQETEMTSSEKSEITSFLSQTERLYSVTDENSDIYRINRANGGEEITVSPETADFIELCKRYYRFTNGKFNAGILPLSTLWGLSADTYNKVIMTAVPEKENIEEKKAVSVDFCSNFAVSDKGVTKRNDLNKLDLGGIVKGYSVDGIRKILQNHGRKQGYISIGGSSVYIFSVKEDLLIKHPRKSGEYILSVSNSLINGAAISTSGDYQRCYFIGEKRYCHIIDCEKGAPIDTGLSSVTVIGDKSDGETNSACWTDMISTALMCMEEDELKEFVSNNLPSISVFAVYEKGGVKKILTNREMNKDFTLKDTEYTVEKF